MQEQPDEVLVREVVEGNISAFEELVRRYQGKLLSFVAYMVWDAASAQDVVQESFIAVYKTIDRIDTKRKFSSYLFSIARNHAISFVRSRKPHIPLEVAESVTSINRPDKIVEEAEEKRRIEEALERIDRKYKQVITLYYFDDLSYEEISKRLRLPVNTIRTHLRRAKAVLRKELSI